MNDWKLIEEKIVGEIEKGSVTTTLYEYIGKNPTVVFGSITISPAITGEALGLAVSTPKFFPVMGNASIPLDADAEAWRLESELFATLQGTADEPRATAVVFCRPNN